MKLLNYTKGMVEGTRSRQILGYYAIGHQDIDRFLRTAADCGYHVEKPRHVRWTIAAKKYYEVEAEASGCFPVTVAMVGSKERELVGAAASRNRRIEEVVRKELEREKN